MKLKSKHVALLALTVFFVGIGGTMAFNLWRTETEKIPTKLAGGEHEGEYNPSDIRGSYTFSEISEFFNIPLETLSKAFGLEGVVDVAEFECQELKELYPEPEEGEIGTDSAKLFVALYTGRPHTPEETTLLPTPALSALEERLSLEELRDVERIIIDMPALIPQPTRETAGQTTGIQDRQVRGNTTFAELQDWELTKDEIEEVMEISMGNPGVSVRNHCADNEIDFGEVKTALQALVDVRNK
jgi:hypothetical protein